MRRRGAKVNDMATSKAPQNDTEPEQDEEEGRPAISSRFLLLTAVPSWLVSLVVHFLLILILVLLPVAQRATQKRDIVVDDTADAEEIDEFVMEDFEPIDELKLDFDKPPEQMEEAVIAEENIVSDFQELEAATQQVDLADFADQTAPFSEMMTSDAGLTGNGTSGRGQATRTKMLSEGGGNGGSEAAVVAGIKWIADHQLPDGTWNFDHRRGAKKPGESKNFGEFSNSPRAATAMGLLPFLGSGHTHKEGKYKKEVNAGLTALVRLMKVRGVEGDLTEAQGNMYSHGLGSIALCEAYAMTQDKNLAAPAQASLNYIVRCQDPVGGGWRYQPRQAGDTSVVGWQLMALKSGHMGYLEVPRSTINGAMKFLDSVQADGGAKYGYVDPGAGTATTSVGLLCRMYLGWKKDNPALEKGVDFLAKTGPSVGNNANMYYNYYATQVLRHYGGPKWDAWNQKQRDFLINTQVKDGQPEGGSWFFNGSHADKGGRLYNTSLAVLTLEVYYRHLPIYKNTASEEDFPL